MTLTNFSPSELNLLWADIRQHIFRHWNVGSGRKCAVSARDLLLMMLASLKHCGTWDIVAQIFRTTVATFEKHVMSFIEVMHPYLLRKYVHGMASKWSMHELAANGTRFEHYPYTRYATDVTFQKTNVPVGSYAEKKLYSSGKRHLYGHKVEVSVLPNGFAINCTSYHKGSVSDKAIFDDNLDFHRTNLTKHPSEMEMTDTDGRVEQWAVLADKGYQGIQHEVRAVLPTKKPSGGFLTFDQQCTNDRIATDRVVVENYFCRLNTLWAVCGDAYRWNRKNYDVLFQTCVAITNVHIRFNPLRAEDVDANTQYVNRLNTIGLKKKKAQQKYREKRKTRLTFMRETLTLQFGSASNQLADKLWHSVLSELNADKSSITTDGARDSSMTYRNGRYTPRAVSFCSKGGLSKAKPRSVDTASSAWDGNVQVISQDSEDAQAVATPLPSRAIVEVNEFRHFDPLNNFYDGVLGLDAKGVQCIVDVDSTWGGFASEVLRGFREECPSAFVSVLGLDTRYPVASQADFFDLSKQSGRRSINLASSVLILNELSSLFIPFSPHTFDAGAVAWNCLSSVYRWRGSASTQDLLFRPNATVMELSCSLVPPATLFAMPPLDRVAHWDQLSSFPVIQDCDDTTLRKFRFQFLAVRGLPHYSFDRLAGQPFDHWRSTVVAKPLFDQSSHPVDGGAVASLSITDRVPKYLEALATGVKHVDPRVVHEFTQAGMTCDGIRDLHDDLMSLSDSVL
ncbi:hypothetical protein DYB38_000806 [Aphanomyces astaci]|uniref:DDE Tnp4 domain-containing protein n=1 Tax=Aphanomyces astaci TaxID=112090 RepID=A0A397CFB2_APHAT|nr:hypothetical protein DYB38_000806 [Aphanomyces astaci]